MKVRTIYLAAFLGAVALHAGQVTVTVECAEHDVTFTTREGMTVLSGRELRAPADAPGSPWVPARYLLVALPSGAVATNVSVTGEEKLLRRDVLLAPVQPPHPRSKPRRPLIPPDPVAYASDTLTPRARVELCGTHHLRGYTFASLRVNPIRYQPRGRTLWLAPRMTITVDYAEPPSGQRGLARPSPVFAAMAAALAHNVDMLSAATAPPAERAAGVHAGSVDYLIITSQALSNAFSVLATHRTSRGLRAAIETVERIAAVYPGADLQQKIRACISNYVATRATSFVVLGGDDTVVPDRDCYAYCAGETELAMPTDLYYSDLTGTWDADGDGRYGETTDGVDLAPDVIVGRIPVRTTQQAADYIAKVVAFENNRPAALMEKMLIVGTETWDTYTGSSRPADTLGDGHPEFRAPNHPYVSDSEIWTRRMYRDVITQYWRATELRYFFDTLTSWDGPTAGDYPQTAANVHSKMNLGWGHVFFSDHGYESGWALESGNYTTTEAAALNNRVVLVYTDSCLTGHFDGSPEPCFSEAMLRNPTGGALVYLGCSRYGWGEPGSYYGGPSSDYAHRFYHRLMQQPAIAGGVAFALHKADMIPECATYGAERWIQFGLNFQGDPAIWFGKIETNRPPALQTPVSRQVGLVGAPLQFTVHAFDTVDRDMITLNAANVPAWATFTPVSNKGSVSAVFSGTPSAPSIADVTFTARDKDGATSATVRVVAGALGLASDLLISEYGEGTGYNKYLELYNGTTSTVDLTQYSLRKQVNGAGPYTDELALSGTLAPGACYVIVYNQADASLREKADLLTGSLCLAFNGNDALGLFARGDGRQVDEVGVFNSATYWGADVTLVRQAYVSQPRVPYVAGEWDTFPANSWDDVGIHVIVPEPVSGIAVLIAFVVGKRTAVRAS